MVGQQTLNLFILVRIQVPEPAKTRHASGGSLLSMKRQPVPLVPGTATLVPGTATKSRLFRQLNTELVTDLPIKKHQPSTQVREGQGLRV